MWYINGTAIEQQLKRFRSFQMSFKHHTCDPRSERLLLVTLEEPEQYSREFRHINATVIRRAVPHTMRAEAPLTVAEYNDEYAEKCSGYRNASYVFTGKVPTYVDDMQLRGQLDTGVNPMCEGKPYGNQIRFSPFLVDSKIAFHILDFFKKLEKYNAKHDLGNYDRDFYTVLYHLAQFLKVTTVLFYKPGVRSCNLSQTNNFEEVDLLAAKGRIDALLQPFYQPKIS
jgi:hypothetical protein